MTDKQIESENISKKSYLFGFTERRQAGVNLRLTNGRTAAVQYSITGPDPIW